MEHTGIYGMELARFLYNRADYCLESPIHIKRSLGLIRGKNDKVDAFQISRFCYLHREELTPGKLPAKTINMINSALVISEIEAGMFQKAKNSFNIHELLNHAYAVFLDVARLKGISLHKNIPEQEVIINGHNSLLQRAIANIIDNAIKFSDFNGEVTICSRIEGQNIFIEIKDTGIGIQKEEQLKIFNKFYKVNRSRSDTGNGLGLSIAKAYIDLHHGRIVVDSLPDRGTAFTILLPLTEKQNT